MGNKTNPNLGTYWGPLPWWAWLLIGLAALACLACILSYFLCCHKNTRKIKKKKGSKKLMAGDTGVPEMQSLVEGAPQTQPMAQTMMQGQAMPQFQQPNFGVPMTILQPGQQMYPYGQVQM